MGYYILQQDRRIPDQPTVIKCPKEIEPDEWLDGRVLSPPSGTLRLVLSPRSGTLRSAMIGGIVTLFHERFRADLERLGVDNVQYFPVELENPQGGIERNYFLVNVLGLLEAVDAGASVIKPRASGGRGQLYSFKVDPNKAKSHRLFRLAEAPTLIILDESLRNSFANVRTPGTIMLPTERYDGW